MVTVTEAFVIESEKTASERDHLHEIVRLKDEQIAAQNAEIAAWKQQNAVLTSFVEIQRQQVKEWSIAALQRKEAIVFDDKAAKLQDAEILRVRAERDSARKGQRTWGAVGLVMGIALGYLGARNK